MAEEWGPPWRSLDVPLSEYLARPPSWLKASVWSGRAWWGSESLRAGPLPYWSDWSGMAPFSETLGEEAKGEALLCICILAFEVNGERSVANDL